MSGKQGFLHTTRRLRLVKLEDGQANQTGVLPSSGNSLNSFDGRVRDYANLVVHWVLQVQV